MAKAKKSEKKVLIVTIVITVALGASFYFLSRSNYLSLNSKASEKNNVILNMFDNDILISSEDKKNFEFGINTSKTSLEVQSNVSNESVIDAIFVPPFDGRPKPPKDWPVDWITRIMFKPHCGAKVEYSNRFADATGGYSRPRSITCDNGKVYNDDRLIDGVRRTKQGWDQIAYQFCCRNNMCGITFDPFENEEKFDEPLTCDQEYCRKVYHNGKCMDNEENRSKWVKDHPDWPLQEQHFCCYDITKTFGY